MTRVRIGSRYTGDHGSQQIAARRLPHDGVALRGPYRRRGLWRAVSALFRRVLRGG